MRSATEAFRRRLLAMGSQRRATCPHSLASILYRRVSSSGGGSIGFHFGFSCQVAATDFHLYGSNRMSNRSQGLTHGWAIAILFCVIAMQPTRGFAEAAVAFGQYGQGEWTSGSGHNYRTSAEAQSAAMTACNARGYNCAILKTFNNTCVAVAAQDGDNDYAYRFNRDLAAARQAALSACQTKGLPCTIAEALCDNVSEAEGQVAEQQKLSEREEYLKQWRACFSNAQADAELAASILACDQAGSYIGAVPDDRKKLARRRASFAMQREELQQKREREAREEQRRIEQERRERAEQEERSRAAKLVQSQLEDCKAYNISACDDALRSPNATSEDHANIRSWRATAERFNEDVAACKSGSVAACDVALASPAASSDSQQYIKGWREAASPWNKTKSVGAWISDFVSTIPASTIAASAIATVFASLFGAVVLRQRNQLRRLPRIDAQPPIYLPPPAQIDPPSGPPLDGLTSAASRASENITKVEPGIVGESKIDVAQATRAPREPDAIGAKISHEDASDASGSHAIAKGFGIAGLCIALIGIIVPVYGPLHLSALAIALVTIGALAGDRVFAIAVPIVALVNFWFLSPFVNLLIHSVTAQAGSAAPLYFVVAIFFAAPFCAIYCYGVGLLRLGSRASSE